MLLTTDWIEVIEPANRAAVESLRSELDAGESEAIVLAQQLQPSMLLMDERLGRRAAIRFGLNVTGLLGVLAEGKKRGLITACAPLLDSMIGRRLLDRRPSPIRFPEGARRNRRIDPTSPSAR